MVFTTLATSQLKKLMTENIYSLNPLYLILNHVNGYLEEKNENKYLVFDDITNKHKEVIKKYTELWDKIKNEIKAINGG